MVGGIEVIECMLGCLENGRDEVVCGEGRVDEVGTHTRSLMGIASTGYR